MEVPVSEPVNIPEEPVIAAQRESEPGHSEHSSDKPELSTYEAGVDEYEYVLGRRQIAIWAFAGIVVLATFSTASYYVGRMSAPNPFADLDGKSESYVAPAAPAVAPASATTASSTPTAPMATAPEATIVLPGQIANPPGVNSPAARADPAAQAAANEPPLFADPQPGALYLQMGAVDKGIAVVLAEGLRRHGFNSIVAPGPKEKIFRVLIGPFATQADFKRAQAEVDAIDLSTFARRYQK